MSHLAFERAGSVRGSVAACRRLPEALRRVSSQFVAGWSPPLYAVAEQVRLGRAGGNVTRYLDVARGGA